MTGACLQVARRVAVWAWVGSHRGMSTVRFFGGVRPFAALLALGLLGAGVDCTPGISASTGGAGGTQPTSSSATSTSLTTGTGACVPSCSGKQCGPDGCNGMCGMCGSSSQTCSAAGQCCSPTWSISFPGNGQNLFAAPDGTTVVGTHGGDAFRVACDGTAGPSHTVTPNGTTFVGENAQHDIIGTGDATTAPLHVFFDIPSGGSPALTPLPTLGANESMWWGGLVGKEIWAVGSTMGVSANKPLLWKTDPANPASTCTSDMGITVGATGRSVVADGNGGAYVTVDSTPASVHHVTCTGDCQCTSTQLTNAFPMGMGIRSLALSGTNLYAVGFDNALAAIFRFDAPSGQLLATYTYDPTPLLDAFNTVATDGVNVYAGGGRGIDINDPMLATGYSVLAILPANFVSSSTPQLVPLTQTDFIWTLSLSTDGVVVSGQKTPGTGFAGRCTLAGVCPADL